MANWINNLAAMRKAAQASATSIDANVAILAAAWAQTPDEKIVLQYRYEFMVGRVMSNKLGDNAAIDYLPAIDAKPMQKGKWLPFPIAKPETFDAKVHRPLDVHNRYRSALTAWSGVRNAAGLPSLQPTRAPRVDEGEKAGESGAHVAEIGNVPVRGGLDTTAIVQIVADFDDHLTRTLNTNAEALTAGAGSLLKDARKAIHETVEKLRNALADDATALSAPTHATPTKAKLTRALKDSAATMAAIRAELEAIKAREATRTALDG